MVDRSCSTEEDPAVFGVPQGEYGVLICSSASGKVGARGLEKIVGSS
jgi:hypothetical protein